MTEHITILDQLAAEIIKRQNAEALLAETPATVERVARTIQEADDPVYRWAELAHYVPMARAALRAMREEE